ncbi:MAG: glycerophosphodiester phosphodiesterase family protein, partial [Bacteriovoracia bacterium]
SAPHPRFPQQQKLAVRKPTLRELLEKTEALVTQRELRMNYNIEIKSTLEDEKTGYQPDIVTFTDAVVKEIRARLSLDRFSVQSFDWRVLRYLHKSYPGVQTVALIEGPYEAQAALRKLGFRPTVFSPYFKFLTKKDVSFFQAKNIKVIPWTVNEVSDMEALRRLGVDGIITDYPDRIRAVKTSP